MTAAKAQEAFDPLGESPARVDRRRRDSLATVNAAASVPGWTAALYLLWRIMQQNEEMLRLLRMLAAKSGVF